MREVNAANLNAAKELVKKYRTVKVEDIYAHREWFTNKNLTESNRCWFPVLYMEDFTGFGSVDSCSLCKTAYMVDGNCNGCIHSDEDNECLDKESFPDADNTPCCNNDSPSNQTYRAILLSKTPEELIVACKNRADYLEHLIQEKENIL